MTNNPYAVPDDDLIDAIRAALNAGDRDTGGGAHPEHVAKHCALDVRSLWNRLNALADAGRIQRVQGIGPDGPRDSYLPDPPEDDSDGPRSREWVA